MFVTMKESFKITNRYISIATPLILFSLISGLYLIFSGWNSMPGVLVTIVLFFMMLCAFLSGWFFMITKAVKNADEDDNQTLFSEFPAGVGEYFLSVLGMLFNTIIITLSILVVAGIAGKKFIGIPDVTYNQIINATANVEAMKAFVLSLSNEQLVKINKWNFLLLFTIFFNYYILMFYAPTVFFKQKNPFIALFISVKDLICRHFFKNIMLFAVIIVSYMILSLVTSICGTNIFANFIMTLVNFYYVTFIAIYVFNYYYSKYAKIGASIDKTV